MIEQTFIGDLKEIPNTPQSGNFPTYTGFATAKPTGANIYDLSGGVGGCGHNRARIIPYADGTDNQTFDMRVYVWNKYLATSDNPTSVIYWVQVMLCQVACVAGSVNGPTTEYPQTVDTITQTYPTAPVSSVEIVSNAADIGAHICVDLKGGQLLQIVFDDGTASGAAALVAFY